VDHAAARVVHGQGPVRRPLRQAMLLFSKLTNVTISADIAPLTHNGKSS
jgi:hypothetical protein